MPIQRNVKIICKHLNYQLEKQMTIGQKIDADKHATPLSEIFLLKKSYLQIETKSDRSLEWYFVVFEAYAEYSRLIMMYYLTQIYFFKWMTFM